LCIVNDMFSPSVKLAESIVLTAPLMNIQN
jgi:hypothetical protein